MKKIFLVLAAVSIAAIFGSCESDAQKAAKLRIESMEAQKTGDMEKARKLSEEYLEIVSQHEGDQEFRKELSEKLSHYNNN